jgi:hypothetical protein
LSILPAITIKDSKKPSTDISNIGFQLADKPPSGIQYITCHFKFSEQADLEFFSFQIFLFAEGQPAQENFSKRKT